MAFDCTFYRIQKRENSTAIVSPDADHIDLSINFKGGDSIIAPRIVVSDYNPIRYNYCYIPKLNRYYWVADWSWLSGRWEATLKEDVLSSYRHFIGETSAYVLRASASWDGEIMDTLYPTNSAVQNVYTTLENPWAQSLGKGTYVLGIVNSDKFSTVGGVNFYYFTQEQLQNLNDRLLSDIDWLDISPDDLSVGLQKVLFNPFQYITSVLWFPFKFKGSGVAVSNLKFGWWELPNISCIKTVQYSDEISLTFTIPKHPMAATRGNYLNLQPFSRHTLNLKPFGAIPLDSACIKDASELNCKIKVDILTGQAVLSLSVPGGKTFYTASAMCATPLQLAQIGRDYIGTTATAISSVGDVASNLMTLDFGGAISSAASGIDSTLKAAAPQLATSGGTGTMVDFRFEPVLHSQFYKPVADSLSDRGRPLCQQRKISELPGYLMIADPDLDIPCTYEEAREIKAYMIGGFFYE